MKNNYKFGFFALLGVMIYLTVRSIVVPYDFSSPDALCNEIAWFPEELQKCLDLFGITKQP